MFEQIMLSRQQGGTGTWMPGASLSGIIFLGIGKRRWRLEAISIIMPVLNEAGTLEKTLPALSLAEREELVIVDGGSTDETVALARGFTDRVYQTRRGRGHQMGYGAERARGDILLFLHADCTLPGGAFGLVRDTLRDASISAGAFCLAVDSPSLKFRLVETGANLRSRMTRIPYGDQGLFLRRETYQRIGGFRDMPLMEDIDIAQRLKREGKVVFVRPPVTASPRRWLAEGTLYTTLRDWALALSYSVLKVSPERLARYYQDVR